MNICVSIFVNYCKEISYRNLVSSSAFHTMHASWTPTHCPCFVAFVITHDDVIQWKHFLGYWPFVRGIHRSPVISPHKDQWRGALMFSLIWINGWVNNREAGDLRRDRAHYNVTVMFMWHWVSQWACNTHKRIYDKIEGSGQEFGFA